MDYTAAHDVALAKFHEITLEDIAEYSGYPIDGNRIKIDFLGRKFSVDYPSGQFFANTSGEGEISVPAQILILHYLVNRSLAMQTGQYITYKELPGGSIYTQPFTNRAINPLVKSFGHRPKSLVEAACKIGGVPVSLGDVAVSVEVFPKVPVTMVLWEGDEEFSASGNILFDRSAGSILPTEDYAVLASMVVLALHKLATT
ncbi:hypothetical protein Desdi_2607 [Desulfitobacterium dichloroeliminans LMG P-21439]|uniref:DUF3786 domain-containing protein n=1 Tax=Desulfitobacterium dichloroeliminans (strain LMG P-21439 / DCA1) TaxID=871963 RepID=L0FAS6_DESDL|nr:DUF3786 domain-containing protein [Desulfitobacterium dichloroeliminans]AGA70023.1 hypothetical protein Desdi_2607 [Desulfitobacterium dichloroeliminans LMG P-21439]